MNSRPTASPVGLASPRPEAGPEHVLSAIRAVGPVLLSERPVGPAPRTSLVCAPVVAVPRVHQGTLTATVRMDVAERTTRPRSGVITAGRHCGGRTIHAPLLQRTRSPTAVIGAIARAMRPIGPSSGARNEKDSVMTQQEYSPIGGYGKAGVLMTQTGNGWVS